VDGYTLTASRGLGRAGVRAEDLALSGWLVVAAPVLSAVGGTAGPFDAGHPLTGVFLLLGFAGALACLATRNAPAEAPPVDGSMPEATRPPDPAGVAAASWNVLDGAAVGPLVGGLMLVGGTAFAELGLDPVAILGLAFAAVLLLSLLQSRRPTAPVAVRRALVTPYLLGAGGIFWGVIHEVVGNGGTIGGASSQLGSLSEFMSSGAAAVVGLLILGAAVYYAMLIYAPRQIAEREGGPAEWLARFGLFVVSVCLGLDWLSLLGG